MKMCLLTCSAPFLIDEKVFPPLGLLAVGTALRLQGHDVSILDEPNGAERYGLGPTTPEYGSALTMLERIQTLQPDARVIIGGPHAEANAEECLADGFDVVATGDGENVTADMFTADGIVHLGRKPLGEYPIADRSLIDDCRYSYAMNGSTYHYEIDGKPATTIMTSRGCPYHCGFCSKQSPAIRYHTVDRIEEEVSYLAGEWGYKALMIFDDTFIMQARRATEICGVLKRHGMTWRCFVRGDLVVKHGRSLVETMARSGCVEVGIGIESGSDRILSGIHKGEDVATIQEGIRLLRSAGIRVKGFFIVGLPGESWVSVRETERFLKQTPLDDADFTVYQPYRGSPIWENRQDYDIEWDEPPNGQRWYKGRRGEYHCAVRTSSMTSLEIVKARESLESQFRCRHR